MEQTEHKSIFNLQVTPETSTAISGLSQWVTINAILGFATAGFTVISTYINISRISGAYRGNGEQAGSLIFGAIITISISLVLNITLFAAGKFLKSAAENADQTAFGAGVGKLAAYFKIFGILIIIVCSLCLIAFLGVLAMGAGRY